MDVTLTAADLDLAFPFHFTVDDAGRIRSAGHGLRRAISELAEPCDLDDIFEFTSTDSARGVSLRAVGKGLVLRGQLVRAGELRLFVGAPRSSIDDLDEVGKRAMNAELDQRVVERTARMEGELRLAHRLEAVGQLAAGIAHEVNTPIQYVADSIFFLRDAYEALVPLLVDLRASAAADKERDVETAWETADASFLVEQVPKALERMTHGVERVASIVRAMKAFAHPGGEAMQPEDLKPALETTLTVSRNEFKYVADVTMELDDIPLVPCRLGEMNQVFLNLIVNAAHAIEESVKGTTERGALTVRTRVEDANVVVEIADTGHGIPEEIRERIFDPFFTTKPVGKGTGQGLAICRNIVVKHGGTLTFESEVGRGTTFFIRLPLSERAHGSIEPHTLR